MASQADIVDRSYPAPKSHPIVIIGAINSSYADRTRTNKDLEAGAIFAYVRHTANGLRICPTDNLAGDTEEVFLGHDGKPNLIFNSFTNIIEVDHEGISRGDVLMCRCTQNAWVQQANKIVGIVGTDELCAAIDEKAVFGRGEEVKGEAVCEGEHGGLEHFEEGGGVLIGDGLSIWENIAKVCAEGENREKIL